MGPGAGLTTEFVLDTMVVSEFFWASAKLLLGAIAQAFPLVVVEDVDSELKKAKFGTEYARWQPGSGLRVVSIPIGTTSAARFAALRSRKTSLSDIGEHASIAYALDRSDAVFVTEDRNGALIALNEIVDEGVSVTRLAPFLCRVSARVTLPRSIVDAIAIKAQINNAPPTWWAAWLHTLT